MRIHIVPTYECDLRCRYCYASGFLGQFPRAMSLESFREVIDYLLPHGLSRVSLLGGEPTLWPHLAEAVEHARRVGLGCTVFTNGNRMTAEPDGVVLNLTRFLRRGLPERVRRTVERYHDRGVAIDFRVNVTDDGKDLCLEPILEAARSVRAGIQIAAPDFAPHARAYGRRVVEVCRYFADASIRVKVSRPIPPCMVTKRDQRFLRSSCRAPARCNFDTTIPLLNPDGKTVFPCNSLAIPLPLDYIHSRRTDYEEIQEFSPCASKHMPSQCLACPSYLDGECHAGCMGTRTDHLQRPAPRHEIVPVGEITSRREPPPAPPLDWETATRILVAAGRETPPHDPEPLDLGATCNNRCSFCWVDRAKSGRRRGIRSVIAELERRAAGAETAGIRYTGGEPTLRQDLPRILAHAARLGIRSQQVETNARILADPDTLKRLVEAGATSFRVSIHGVDPEIHDGLTGVPGSFRQTCEGLENLERLGCRFSTNTVVTRLNFLSLGRLVCMLMNEFPSTLLATLSFVRPEGRAARRFAKVAAPLWEVLPYVRHAVDLGRAHGLRVETESIPLCLLREDCDRASEGVVRTDPKGRSGGGPARERKRYAACRRCELRASCPGINPGHDLAFGGREWVRAFTFAELQGSD
jgi:MoaA/NifB/PqqE/SkfB family radical SAM enzyme